MSEPTAENVEKVLQNLETLLDQANDQYGGRTRSSIVPTSVKRLFGRGSTAELISSAEKTIQNLRGIIDIDGEYNRGDELYLSDSAVLAVTELQEILSDLAAELDNSHEAEEMADAIDAHANLLNKVVSGAKSEPSDNPMERAMDEMQSTIEAAGLDDLGNSKSKKGEEKYADADSVTSINVTDGDSQTDEEDTDPVGVSVDSELETIKEELDLDE